jgi:hypothetical protein
MRELGATYTRLHERDRKMGAFPAPLPTIYASMGPFFSSFFVCGEHFHENKN